MSSIFIFGSNTVVATRAASNNASMIHFCTFKAGGRVMTSFTACGSADVIIRLTFSRRAIMAAGTACCYASMIKSTRRDPCSIFMARLAASASG